MAIGKMTTTWRGRRRLYAEVEDIGNTTRYHEDESEKGYVMDGIEKCDSAMFIFNFLYVVSSTETVQQSSGLLFLYALFTTLKIYTGSLCLVYLVLHRKKKPVHSTTV